MFKKCKLDYAVTSVKNNVGCDLMFFHYDAPNTFVLHQVGQLWAATNLFLPDESNIR